MAFRLKDCGGVWSFRQRGGGQSPKTLEKTAWLRKSGL
jgi:hypothetical protein